jgi:hypothetical protein
MATVEIDTVSANKGVGSLADVNPNLLGHIDLAKVPVNPGYLVPFDFGMASTLPPKSNMQKNREVDFKIEHQLHPEFECLINTMIDGKINESEKRVTLLAAQVETMREEAKKMADEHVAERDKLNQSIETHRKYIRHNERSIDDWVDQLRCLTSTFAWATFLVVVFIIIMNCATYKGVMEVSNLRFARINVPQQPTPVGQQFPLDPEYQNERSKPSVHDVIPPVGTDYKERLHPEFRIKLDAAITIQYGIDIVINKVQSEIETTQEVVNSLVATSKNQGIRADDSIKSLKHRIVLLNSIAKMTSALRTDLARHIRSEYSLKMIPEYGNEVTVIAAQHYLRDVLDEFNVNVRMSIDPVGDVYIKLTSKQPTSTPSKSGNVKTAA